VPFWTRRRTPPTAARAVTEELIESLEQRLAFYVTPFLADPPDLTAMENNWNTVVRMQTSQGNIDIELYDAGGPPNGQPAPRTVANFLNYVRTGRYDGTFFHRLQPH
jgi:hypothetical protein